MSRAERARMRLRSTMIWTRRNVGDETEGRSYGRTRVEAAGYWPRVRFRLPRERLPRQVRVKGNCGDRLVENRASSGRTRGTAWNCLKMEDTEVWNTTRNSPRGCPSKGKDDVQRSFPSLGLKVRGQSCSCCRPMLQARLDLQHAL